MKYAIAILLCLASFAELGLAQDRREKAAPPREETLRSLIDEALSRNPDIAAEYYNMEAAAQRIPQAGTLDAPELTFKLMEIPGTRFNEAMYANIELMQMIPFPTKLNERRSIASLLSEHAHHEHLEKIIQVIADLKTALARLWYARESLKITNSNSLFLNRILTVSEASYSVGTASQLEILRTKIELSKLVADEASDSEEVAAATNMVRRILNRSASEPIGSFELGSPDSIPPPDALVAYSIRNRPMLVHDSLNVVEKEMNVRLMKQEYIPDLRFSVEYVRMPVTAENRWSVSAGISLPFAPWTISKTSAKVQEAEAEQMALSSVYSSSRNMIESEIRTSYASLVALMTEMHQLRDSALPLLRQSIDLLLTDYATGRSSYVMVLDTYRMYNDVQRELAMANMKYHQKLAELGRAVGVTDVSVLLQTGKE